MSNPSVRGAICYESEATFGENVTTFATLRVPTAALVDPSGLQHEKLDSQRTVQRRQDGTQWILGTQKGTFKIKLWLTGHGSATSGATTAALTETLLGYVLGTSTVSAASGTTFTGGTASVPLTTASGTFAAGSLCRNGVLGDGRGNGQFAAISTHAATSLNLLTALDGAPTNGDILYSATNMYVTEDPVNSVAPTSCRFLLQTANLQYECHGCVPTNIAWGGLNPAQVPFVEITYSVAWWQYNTSAFPSAVATETFQPAAVATGSVFLNDVGTVTRAKRTARDFSINHKLGMELLPGPGGVGTYQAIVGARRTSDVITVQWTEDADTATTTPVLPGYGTGTTAKHLLYTLNPTAQKAVGFYFPNLCIMNVAVQMQSQNINRLRISAQAYTGTTTTTDLTASAMRMAWA